MRVGFSFHRARASRRARGRRRGNGGRDEATAIARGVSSRGLERARGADESCVRRGVDGDAFDESGRLTDD